METTTLDIRTALLLTALVCCADRLADFAFDGLSCG